MQIDSVLIRTSAAPEVEGLRAKFERGMLSEKIDANSIRAYVDWAPCVQALVQEFEALGVEVSKPGYVGDLLKVLEFSGKKFIKTLNDDLQNALSRAVPIAREYAQTIRAAADGRIASIERSFMVVILLVAIDPTRYPLEPPPGVFAWPISERLIHAARKRATDS